jgi:translation initiation factor 2B subunit (eIF-2B alpha/beta/delta family)
MAPFLTLANALWSGVEEAPAHRFWSGLHDALLRYANGRDRKLLHTLRHASEVVRSDALVLTYSHSTAVRLALLRALTAGRRFEVVCSESRPMSEGVPLARHLATAGIPVHLTTDAALAGWVERADLVLLGADAVCLGRFANKVGSEAILHAARRGKVPAYVLADSSKWLPEGLTGFWRVREEAPREIVRVRHPNLHVYNRYFDLAPLALLTGLVWEGGIARPAEVRRRIARLAVSQDLVGILTRRK